MNFYWRTHKKNTNDVVAQKTVNYFYKLGFRLGKDYCYFVIFDYFQIIYAVGNLY